MTSRWLQVSMVAVALGLMACGAEPATQPSSAGLPAEPAESPGVQQTVTAGQELFISKGCAACHGQDAEGTSVAPPLAGHTASQVKRQARAPLGIMPVFPPDKVSNEDLETIAEFVVGLAGEHIHMREPGPDELALHHWMVLFSIEAENAPEAVHHLGHIINLTEGEHLSRMEQAVAILEEGDVHDAAHLVEEMLAGLEQTGLDEQTMHLTLALASIRVEEATASAHHVAHFVGTAEGHRLEQGESILVLLREGEIREAEHELEQLLGEAGSQEEAPDEDEHEIEATPSAINFETGSDGEAV